MENLTRILKKLLQLLYISDTIEVLINERTIKMFDMPEPYEYETELQRCVCVDCVGDFSGASEDEDFGGR